MTDQAAFPIFVLAKDCGDIFRFDNERQLQGLEAIDVENGEYEAWDARGRRLALISKGLTTFSSGHVELGEVGETLEESKFQELKARAQEP